MMFSKWTLVVWTGKVKDEDKWFVMRIKNTSAAVAIKEAHKGVCKKFDASEDDLKLSSITLLPDKVTNIRYFNFEV